MARSERALAILRRRVALGERILDLGCGDGAGTVKYAPYYDTYGLEVSRERASRARLRAPSAHVTTGRGENLPYPDGHFAAVLMLDVLEHVGDEQAVLAEVVRVLRPGGLLVLSVPNSGLMRWFDSYNLYPWLVGEDPWARPGTPKQIGTYHRHYTLRNLVGLLGSPFKIDYVHYSGLGLAELVHLPGLLIGKRLLRSRGVYLGLVFIYIGAYILEDLVPFNRSGYHLMITARRLPSPSM